MPFGRTGDTEWGDSSLPFGYESRRRREWITVPSGELEEELPGEVERFLFPGLGGEVSLSCSGDEE